MHFLGSQRFIFFCLQRYELLRGLGKNMITSLRKQKGKRERKRRKKEKKGKKKKEKGKKGKEKEKGEKEGKRWFLAHTGK